MRTQLASIALVCGLFAAPVAAQNSANDFQLPEGQSGPAARPQGPVDDTGIIPVGPRVIRTEPERPAAIPEPQEAQPVEPQTQAEPEAEPAATPAPRPAAQRNPTPVAQPAIVSPPIETPAQQLPPDNAAEPDVATVETISAPTTQQARTEEADPTSTALPQWVLWLAASLGVAAMALGVAAWLIQRKQKTPLLIAGPAIDKTSTLLLTNEPPRFATRLEIISFTRSMMMVTVKFSLQISNRSDIAMRDVRICADLISTRRKIPMEQQVASEATVLEQVADIARIGPQQARSVTGTVQMSTHDIELFFQGKTPVFVPLARLKVQGKDADPLLQTYVLGSGSPAGKNKVTPIPLDTPPGTVRNIRARILD